MKRKVAANLAIFLCKSRHLMFHPSALSGDRDEPIRTGKL